MSERVAVGRVGKSHGLAGAFVVEDASAEPDRFAVGSEVLVGGAPARVVESKQARGRPVIRLDRRVERGATLEVERDALPPTGADEYYVFQLVGCDVVGVDGRAVGRVADVASGVANDVLEVEGGALLPMVEECILEVDLEGRRIVVAPGFADPG